MSDFKDYIQLNSFKGEKAVKSKEEAMPFWNRNEFEYYRIEERNNREFFETQVVERAFVGLRSDRRYMRYSQSDIEKMYDLVRRFIHLMGTSYNPNNTLFRIDDMSERSIEVRYPQRQDVSVNLFIKETDTDVPDYEETYISFTENGQNMIMNDTMEGMVRLVKRLLSE